MNLNVLGRIGFLAAAVALAGCATDTRAADEAALRALIKDWSASAQAKDPVKFASFYTEDGIVMLAGAPDFKGMSAIREGITGLMQDPAFALSFEADNIVVARAGDLAYETGTYSFTVSGPDKKPAPEKGHYVVVWRKQPDGTWKAAIDAPVSDPPDAAAAAHQH